MKLIQKRFLEMMPPPSGQNASLNLSGDKTLDSFLKAVRKSVCQLKAEQQSEFGAGRDVTSGHQLHATSCRGG